MESIDGIEPLDVLAVFPHPGQAEWACGGTLRKFVLAGKRAGIVDLTAGECATLGTPDERWAESEEAARVLGIAFRGCRKFPDARLENTLSARMTVVADLRRLRPELVILPHTSAQHPDVRVAAQLVADACYLSGIAKLDDDTPPHRPKRVIHAAPPGTAPSFVVDIGAEFDVKLEALFAHRSQVAGREEFARERITAEASTQAIAAGLRHAEGFTAARPLVIGDPAWLL
jgi:bacillithiol biosynthesis deacetylase BshB1